MLCGRCTGEQAVRIVDIALMIGGTGEPIRSPLENLIQSISNSRWLDPLKVSVRDEEAFRESFHCRQSDAFLRGKNFVPRKQSLSFDEFLTKYLKISVSFRTSNPPLSSDLC